MFDKILDFLFRRVFGVIIASVTVMFFAALLTGCIGTDMIACFARGFGCYKVEESCVWQSQNENKKIRDCLGGESCGPVDTLFGESCVAECGSCYAECGGLNYSLFETVCYGEGCGKGYYSEGNYYRFSCMNCFAYCDKDNDPESPVYSKKYIGNITVHQYGGITDTVSIYRDTERIFCENMSDSGLIFMGYYTEENGVGIMITDEHGNIVNMPEPGTHIYAYYIEK